MGSDNSGLGVVQSSNLLSEIIESDEFQKILPHSEEAQKKEQKS